MRYELADTNGVTSLFDDGKNVGDILRWYRSGDGLAVVAGRYDRAFILTETNSDLGPIVQALNGLITSIHR